LPEAVIPAQAGIHFAQDAQELRWMPAGAGMTRTDARPRLRWGQALRGHDGLKSPSATDLAEIGGTGVLPLRIGGLKPRTIR